MPPLLQSADEWLTQMLFSSLAETVIYRKSGGYFVDENQSGKLYFFQADQKPGQPIELKAVVGRTRYDLTDTAGITVKGEVQDFIFEASALDLIGEPEPGDTIEHQGRLFEVVPLSEEGCWRWATAYKTRIRVHTRLIRE